MINSMWTPRCSMTIIILTGILIFSFYQSVAAQEDLDNDGILDIQERQLASSYFPYLHFAAGEEFFPTVVSYHIDNSVLYLKSGNTDALIDSSPTIASISLYQAGDYFLDNVLGASEEIAEDYKQKKEGLGYTIYSRVTLEGEYIVIQYWLFYAFNPGSLNQHEGDWEMIEIVLDQTETALYAAYSQHSTGERASWNDVEKANKTHPRVYVALGSHANYFRPYQGKLGLENDVVGNGFTLEPEDNQLVLLGEKGSENHPSSQDWLEYGGRWGDWAELADISLGRAGPRGPGHGENEEKWSKSISWGSDTFRVNQTWFSLSFITFYFLYIFAGIIAILVVIKVWRIVKRKRQGKLNLLKIMHSKGGVGVVLGIVGIALYLVALFLPWYVVRGNIQTTLLETVGETDLVLIDGVNGLRVNTLQSDQGLTQLFGLGIPFAIILLTSVVLNLLDLIGVEKAERLSRTYVISAITSLIPVIIILVSVILLSGLVMSFANVMVGEAVPPQIDEMTREMASSPIMGEYSDTLDSYGILRVFWGLGIGAYIFIAAAATKLAAGIFVRRAIVPEKQETEKE